MMSEADAEFIEARKLERREISRLFGIPRALCRAETFRF
jgi:phage portal protein BeeE